jgi:AraC-like DNA-binding protein
MLDIVALVTSNDARERIVTSLRRRAKIRLASTHEELIDLVTRTAPSAVICEFGDRTDPGVANAIRELRRRRPTLPMIGYCRVDEDSSRHIMAATGAGVNAVALRDAVDIGAMLEGLLEQAEVDTAFTDAMKTLGTRVPPIVRQVLDHCIRHSLDVPSVTQLGQALGVSRRTLGHRLSRAGAPTAGALISWSRLFVAMELLVDEGRSVDQTALALGFTSGSALRGMLQRYTGLTPRQLRDRGGLNHLVELFTNQLHERMAVTPLRHDADAQSTPTNETQQPAS